VTGGSRRGKPSLHQMPSDKPPHTSPTRINTAAFLTLDDEDDSGEGADNMDPLTFAKYYANTIP
jgi:hypothetical protein